MSTLELFNDIVVNIQRTFRKKRLMDKYKQIKDLNLISNIINSNHDQYKIFLHTSNVYNKLKEFINCLSLYIQKKVIPPEQIGYTYLIFGYSDLVIDDDDIILLSKKVVMFLENIENFDLVECNELYDRMYKFYSYLTLYSLNNPSTLTENYVDTKLCKIDNIIQEFYDSISASMAIDDVCIMEDIINIQLDYIDTIYKLSGKKGIEYMKMKLEEKISLNNLNSEIQNKLSLIH